MKRFLTTILNYHKFWSTSCGLFVWYLIIWLQVLAGPRPGSLSLRPRTVRLELVPGPVGVRVVLRQGRGVLPRQAGVRRDQALLHPLLLLHPPVLKPDFHLKSHRGLAKVSWTNFMLTCFSVTVSGVFLEISTWVSFSWSAAAISIRLARVRYLLKWNSFSSSVNCLVEKFVRPVLLMPPPPPWPP